MRAVTGKRERRPVDLNHTMLCRGSRGIGTDRVAPDTHRNRNSDDDKCCDDAQDRRIAAVAPSESLSDEIDQFRRSLDISDLRRQLVTDKNRYLILTQHDRPPWLLIHQVDSGIREVTRERGGSRT
jgi:hypothetical protein